VFDTIPADTAELRGLDDAALIDAVAGSARVSAAADARKYAAIAELERRRCTDEHPNWACDDWDAAAAEVAAALNTGHGRASGEVDMAIMLRDRFPGWARYSWRANSVPAGSGSSPIARTW
jgi:hypothetical protein